jgi:hypothetical protein
MFQDVSFAHGVLTESFETSVAWDRVMNLIRNVKTVVKSACKSKLTKINK